MRFDNNEVRAMRPDDRLYNDRKWHNARTNYLGRYPVCVGCAAIGKLEPATAVDHIKPHNGNVEAFWDEGNWQPCCAWHHNSIKASLERMWFAKQVTIDALVLTSPEAIALTRKKMKIQIGLDGWPA
jgi:5-methylcytosine-specific restriction enzyme A